MKPEKMTDEELSDAFDAICRGYTSRIAMVRAHIAALEAERDDLRKEMADECRTHMRTQDDARILREWVQTREGHITELHALWREAESHLAAIRKRAEDRGRIEMVDGHGGPHAVARFIVGETASETRCNLHSGKKCDPETPGVYECGRHCSCQCHAPASPEPSTAEAFATAKLYAVGDGVQAISLLERRMGAMERAVKCLADAPPAEWLRLFAELQDALTDAPAVFTLEEVRKVVHALGPLSEEYVMEQLTALRR